MSAEKFHSIDEGFEAIDSPYAAEKYYLPKVLSGEMDLSAVRKELREIHKMDDENVRISARAIGDAHLKNLATTSHGGHAIFGMIVGASLIVGGIIFFFILWDSGWIASAPIFMAVLGVTLIFRAVKGDVNRIRRR
jgi:hypothetical protein